MYPINRAAKINENEGNVPTYNNVDKSYKRNKWMKCIWKSMMADYIM